MPAQITIDTTSATVYQNLTPDSFAGVTANSMVSVQGWLFSTPSGATPSTVAGETVVGRANGFF
jgi:hypothetical protein